MATATKKPRRKKPTRGKAPQRKSAVRLEAKLLILAAVGILAALSVYIEGSIGFVGAFISRLFMGMFGFGAYVLPLALIAYAGYRLFSRGKVVPSAVIVQALCLLWALTAFMHLVALPEQSGLGLWAYVQLLYSQGAGSNGGLLGGLLGNVLRRLLGSVGAYIVLTLGALALFVLMTGRSFSQGLTRVWDTFRSHMQSAEDEEDEYDEDFEEEPPVKRKSILKPLPERAPKRKVKKRGNIFDIRDATGRHEGKILLFHEDINQSKAYKSKVLPFKTPEPEPEIELEPDFTESPVISIAAEAPLEETVIIEEEIAAETVEIEETEPLDLDISVRGLVDEEVPIPVRELPPAPVPVPTPAPAPKAEEPAFGTAPRYENYQFPPIDLLSKSPQHNQTESRTQILENSRILEETLRSFRVEAKVVEVSVGPTVTRYDLAPGPGVKVATIANLSNDLALSLAAQGIRIEAPIPGKAAVGIEIPNKDPQAVFLRDILEDDIFKKFPSALAFGVGKDIAGAPVVTDVAKMPHLLIAGATGAGKSVCINTLIASVLYKSHPDEVKLLMVDPKVVELSMYNGIPHLLVPVVTDPKKASDALQWAVAEMEQRYKNFAEVAVRDLKGYNHYVKHVAEPSEDGEELQIMPQIIIIIDELADLMMTCKGAVEESICRLAQKARAAGIHMVLATQRPSVDVITGLIKANIPSRLAFAVSSGTDSRTVLDMTGAEKLLGRGDMLFLPVGQSKPTRLQGGFISDKEVESVVEFLKAQTVTVYPPELVEQVTSPAKGAAADEDLDEFFREAAEFLIEKGKGSTSMLQRRFRIGYNRASRLMEDLQTRGIVGPEDGVKPRKIEMSWEEYQERYGG